MKLVELVAKEISEWPEGAIHCVQDSDGCFKFGAGNAPKYDGGMWFRDIEIEHDLHNGFLNSKKSIDLESSIVTREMWQAERDRQKGGEWKRHRAGRKQPVPGRTKIEVKFRDGEIHTVMSDRVDWIHYGRGSDLMQYRVISQPQAEEVEAKRNAAKDVDVEYAFGAPDADMSKLDWKPLGHGRISDIEFDDVTTEEVEMIKVDPVVAANVEAFNRQWQIGRVDSPLVWRDTVTELNAYIEEFTRERDELINRLASEGFALIPAMTPVVGVADVDMSDWRNWKEGDIVKCINTNYPSFISVGTMYKITGFDGESILFRDDQGDDMDDICVNFEFHSRP